jgi:hypothetical protein
MSSTTAAKTEDRQQDTTVNIENEQQDTAGSPSMLVLYHE